MDQEEFKKLGVIEKVVAIEEMDRGKASAREIKEQLGLNRYDLSHLRRLSRNLTPVSRGLLQANDLSEGHARALCRLRGKQQEEMLRNALRFNWSVRKLEGRVKALLANREPPPDASYYEQLAARIANAIGHPVKVCASKTNPSKGEITITYLGLDAFDAIMQRMRVDLSEDLDW